MTAEQILDGIEKAMGDGETSKGKRLGWCVYFDRRRGLVYMPSVVVHDGFKLDSGWHPTLKDALEDALRKEDA